MSKQPPPRIRLNESPSATKQGPIKAVKAFSLKKSNAQSTAETSPVVDSNKLWTRYSPDSRFSPERKSFPAGTAQHTRSSSSHKEKTIGSRQSPLPGKLRPNSADAVIPSYLTGQWPKDINSQSHCQSHAVYMCDKSAQTVEFDNKTARKKGHRRSASFEQGDQLQTFAAYCGESIFCRSPYKCCETKKGCCYDSVSDSNNHIRPQVWYIWYFWFLIIVMMILCFGGCGYYRRHRLSMLTRIFSQMSVRPATSLEATERRFGRSSEESARQFNFFAYSGPGVNLPESVLNLPPPYAEVINQPMLYPVTKGKLPPYPGGSEPEDYQTVFAPVMPTLMPDQEISLPPPYSECSYDPPQPPLPPCENDISSQHVFHHMDLEQSPSVPSRRTDELT